MARPKIDPTDETVEIRIRIPRRDRDRLVEAAGKFGKPMAEFARLVLAAAANGATQPTGVITLPDESGQPRSAARVKAIVESSHEHKAGPMLSGGIHRCTESGCDARKVGGQWLEVG